MSVVYLVRHAQASFGEADYDRLSTLGVEQARVLGAALRIRLPQVHLVAFGTQRRHQDTAANCLEAMGAAADLPKKSVAGLNEFDHDELLRKLDARYASREALAADILAAEDPRKAFQELFTRAVARWAAGHHDADYTEPWSAFRGRCHAALDEVTSALGPSQVALVFTSGGPITAICQSLLGTADEEAFKLSWTLVNCGVTKLLHTARGLRLSTLNEHAHFEGPRRSFITYR